MADFQYQHMESDHQLQVTQQNLELAKLAQESGFSIRAVTSMDGGEAANTRSAMSNIANIQKSDGLVPEMLHLHIGNQVLSLQPVNPTAGLKLINETFHAQGEPILDADQFLSLPKATQQTMLLDAVNYLDPQNGVINGQTLDTLQGRLDLLKVQPSFHGKDQLVTLLQNAVNAHSDVVDSVNRRLAEHQAQQTKITAPAGAVAAGQKAYATAKGSAQGAIAGQMAATGGSTVTGTINPQTGADEGYLGKLPPAQANIVRSIGEGRIELNASAPGKPRLISLDGGKTWSPAQ